MFNKCKCKWVEVGRTYNASDVEELEGLRLRGTGAINLMRELTFGRTNIELKCSECGDVGFRSVIGKSDPA